MASKRSLESVDPKILRRAPLSFTRSTRQKVFYPRYDSVHEWTKEYSTEEFCNKWLTTDKMPIFYKLINEFLLLIKFGDYRDEVYYYKMVEEIIAYYNRERDKSKTTSITEQDIRNGLIKNITSLYTQLELFSLAKTLTEDVDIVLYHGIDKYSILYKELSELQEKAIFELPIFMSTSFTRDIACQFTRDRGSNIIIRITINKADLSKFKYVYLGNTLVIGADNFRTENEFLLNIFTKLKCTKISEDEKIIYKIPLVAGGSREITDDFTIIDMKFIGYSQFTPEVLAYNLNNLSDTYFNMVEAHKAQNEEEATKAHDAQEAIETEKQITDPMVMGGKTNKRKYKTNKRKYKTNKRKYKTNKRKISIKNLSIKYKFKNKKILTKSRKLYKKGVFTRKNLKTNN
jgi:hypothetical protein